MHLIYLDESGNTGVDFNESRQPVFVLGALLVPEDRWLQLETDLTVLVDRFFPAPRPADFELHATELVNPRGYFRQFAIGHRLDFFQQVIQTAARHQLRFIYRAIVKRRFARWLENTFGSGVLINPHVAAFSLVAQVVQEHLKSLPDAPLGIFISDDNREVAPDVENPSASSGVIVAPCVSARSSKRGFSLIPAPACRFRSATFAPTPPAAKRNRRRVFP